MKKIILLLLLTPFILLSQGKIVKGLVVDNTNQPMPGATVQIKGSTSLGAITDFDGNFSILLDSKDAKVLVVSFIGFLSEEVDIANQNFVSVTLSPDVSELDEVVVVGYGTQRKSDLTGAISSVRVEETIARQSTTVDQLLQGRAAGVRVIQNGTPGSGISIRIRGASSLRGNNEPLYVVDGVIISSAGEDAALADSDGNAIQESQNGLNGINPRDIDKIEVLKDASATAIYGSRGANGVILITTKKGFAGKMKINGYVNTSISQVNKTFEVLNGTDFARFQNERLINNNNGANYQIVGDLVYQFEEDGEGNTVVNPFPLTQYNWQDEIYKLGVSNNVGASFSGGSENGNYFVSMGANNQGGIVDNSLFQSGDIRINLNQQLSSKLNLQARVSGFVSKGEFAQDGDRTSGQRSFISNVLGFQPLVGNDGQGVDNDLGLSNPLSWVNDFEDISRESRYFANVALTYDLPVEGLKYKLQAGGNIRNKERRRFYGVTTFQGSSANGVLAVSDFTSQSYQINNLLQFNRNFNRKHRVNAVLGITYDVRNSENDLYELGNFSTLQFRGDQPQYAQDVRSPNKTVFQKTQLLSYLGRVNYSFNNKYIFTGSFRVDGSSKFLGDNKYSFFPSMSVAWRLSNEDLFSSIDAINELKLRVGWGQIGNQAISAFQTAENFGAYLYSNTSNENIVSFSRNNIANPDLKWETTEQYNAGLDFGFFNNRISGSFEVYRKETNDLLQALNLPGSTGFSTLLINRGSVSNEGIELSLSTQLVNTNDFSIDFGGNISFNRSEILDLGIPDADIIMDGEMTQRSYYLGQNVSSGTYFRSPANIFIKGEEIGLFYGYETDGIYQEGDDISVANFQAGDVRIIDQLTVDSDGDGIADSGDGVIDNNDRTIIGNPNPDFIFGMNLNMSYKRFNLSALFNGSYGNDIANGNLLRLAYAEGTGRNVYAAAYHNAWRPDAPSETYPRIGYNKNNQATSINDRIIEDGSYLRLSNLTLGYDVDVTGVFDSCNIYVSGINLFTLTDYSGYNPEVTNFLNNGNIIGVDWNGLPNVRTYLLGININF